MSSSANNDKVAPAIQNSSVPQKPKELASGPGRLIVLIYMIFALSTGVRALYQVATKFSDAPVSYSLSTLAAAIYVVAAIAIIRGLTSLAIAAVGFELFGVISVGVLSFIQPQWFPEASVWSHFGSGYGYLPLILPIGGLLYLWRFLHIPGNARRRV